MVEGEAEEEDVLVGAEADLHQILLLGHMTSAPEGEGEKEGPILHLPPNEHTATHLGIDNLPTGMVRPLHSKLVIRGAHEPTR